jgi:3,4-dihydroxy 2-butanone 4-phosphate synthase/GTP cyclohydrolase II
MQTKKEIQTKKDIVVSSLLPTKYGTFTIAVHKTYLDNKEHVVLSYGDIKKQPTLVRVHSQCFTGDTLFSMKCDCGEQLKKSMQIIRKKGNGMIIYLMQEGRGIGLMNKIRAYALQEKGLDTVEANLQLGFESDERGYAIAADILRYYGITTITLLTNNPDKMNQLTENGIIVEKMMPLKIAANSVDKQYLQTKKQKMGHIL